MDAYSLHHLEPQKTILTTLQRSVVSRMKYQKRRARDRSNGRTPWRDFKTLHLTLLHILLISNYDWECATCFVLLWYRQRRKQKLENATGRAKAETIFLQIPDSVLRLMTAPREPSAPRRGAGVRSAQTFFKNYKLARLVETTNETTGAAPQIADIVRMRAAITTPDTTRTEFYPDIEWHSSTGTAATKWAKQWRLRKGFVRTHQKPDVATTRLKVGQ